MHYGTSIDCAPCGYFDPRACRLHVHRRARVGTGHKDDQAPAKDDIVVTAQFRSQRLQDAPLAITAVSGAMLEARGQTSIADIGSQAPNVTLRQAPATYGPAVVAYIRGVGQRDTSFARFGR